MLELFKKNFKPKEKETMKREDVQVDMSAVDLQKQLSDACEALASKSAKLEEIEAAFAASAKELEAAKAALAELATVKAAMEAEAEKAKLAARKEKVVAAVGTVKAESLMSATASMDDAAFDAVVSALMDNVAAEAASPAFKEVGVSGEADPSKVEDENGTAALLKKKYQIK